MRNILIGLISACAVMQGSITGTTSCSAENSTTGEISQRTGTTDISCSVSEAVASVRVNNAIGNPVRGTVEVNASAGAYPYYTGAWTTASASADIFISDTVRFWGADSLWIFNAGGPMPTAGSGGGFTAINDYPGNEFHGNAVLYAPTNALPNLVVHIKGYAGAFSRDNSGTHAMLFYGVQEIRGRDAQGNTTQGFTFASAGNFVYPLTGGTQVPWRDEYYGTPEPGTFILMGLGSLLIVLSRRRNTA